MALPSTIAPAKTATLIKRALADLAVHKPRQRPRATAEPSRLHFETLEPRLLLSADLLPMPVPLPPALQPMHDRTQQANGGNAPAAIFNTLAMSASAPDLLLQPLAEATANWVRTFEAGALTQPLQPLPPAGSFVHAGGVQNSIVNDGDSQSFALDVAAGQRIAVRFTPGADAASLQAQLQLVDVATAEVMAFVAAGQAGEGLTLMAVMGGSGGAVRVDLRSLAGVGGYQIELFLGAALETADSQSAADAFDLNAVFAALPGGSGERGAVIGNLGGAGILREIFSDNLDNGASTDIWTLSSNGGSITSGESGEVQNDYGHIESTGFDDGADVYSEAVLRLTLPEQTGHLLLQWEEWGYDYSAELPSGGLLEGNVFEFADGVYVSLDQTQWIALQTPFVMQANNPLLRQVDLSEALAALGGNPQGELFVRFQHANVPGQFQFTDEFGDLQTSYDHGHRFWDNVSLSDLGGGGWRQPADTFLHGAGVYGNASALSDGVVPAGGTAPEGEQTVGWTQGGDYAAVWLDFGQAVQASDMLLSLQAGSAYQVLYWNDIDDWVPLFTVTEAMLQGGGMQLVGTDPTLPGYQSGLAFDAVSARYFAIVPTLPESAAVGEARVLTDTGGADAEDWHRVDLEAGEQASFALRFSAGATRAPSLSIFDAEGNRLTFSESAEASGLNIANFSAPAAGSYFVRVAGATSDDYMLAATRGAQMVGTMDSRRSLDVLPVVTTRLTVDGNGSGNGSLRVAVHQGGQTLVNSLNASQSVTGISAVSVTGDEIDTLQELTAYDVVVIGSSGNTWEYDGFDQALRAWVEAGGAVVATGWTVYAAGPSNAWLPDIDAIVPVNLNSSYDYTYGGNLVVVQDHPATDGITSFTLPQMYSEFPLAGIDDGAQVLARIDGQVGLVVGQAGAGRGVYFGPTLIDQDLDLTGAMEKLFVQTLQWAGGSDSQRFQFQANSGDNIQISLARSGTATQEPLNTLTPRLRLLDSDGVDIAQADADSLAVQVTNGGRFWVAVDATAGAGDVVLRLQGASAVAAADFAVAATSLDGVVGRTSFPSFIDIEFDTPLLLTSVAAGDLLINGTAARGVGVLGPNTLRFDLTLDDGSVRPDGDYLLSLDEGVLTDIHGNALQPWSLQIRLDTTLPVVTASSLVTGAVLNGQAVVVTLGFSEALTASGLTASDVVLRNLTTGTTVAVSSLTLDASGMGVAISLPALGEGAWRLSLLSHSGAFRDLLGLPLDGSPAFPLPSGGGDNQPGNFDIDFFVDLQPLDLGALPAVGNAGQLVYGKTVAADLYAAGDSDDFLLQLDGDQLLTLAVTPVNAGTPLQIAVSLLDTAGNEVHRAEGAAGSSALLQALGSGGSFLAEGSYLVRVSSLQGSGGYRLGVWLGAQAETEPLLPDAGNDSAEAAMALAPSLLDLGVAGRRHAVLGQLSSASDADHYRMSVQAGEFVSVALSWVQRNSAQSLSFELLAPDGSLLASSEGGSAGTAALLTDYRADSAGDLLLRVRGSGAGSGDYVLAATRNLALEGSDTRGDVVRDISATNRVLGGLQAGGSSGQGTGIQVAVVGSNGASITNQLNDDTWFNFSAVTVTGSQVDTLQELRNFDAVIIGDDGNQSQLDGMAPALRQWVEAGGGLVGTGWSVWSTGTNTPPVLSDIDAVLPVNVSGGYNWFNNGQIILSASGHPITAGLGASVTANSYIEFAQSGIDAGATVLGTTNGRPTVVVGEPGAGRSVYLGPTYYRNYQGNNPALDRLLEQAVAWAASDREDAYLVNVRAGDALVITTATPGDGPNRPLNTLDAAIEVYDQAGNLLASNDNGGADGRNARLLLTAAADGPLRVVVQSVSGGGAYVLDVAGATGAVSDTRAQVTSATPLEGAKVSTPPSTITLTLSEGVRADSIATSDLQLDGDNTVTAVRLLSGNRVQFDVTVTPVEGRIGYRLAEGAFTDLQGLPSMAHEGSFVFDLGGPRVVASAPATDAGAPFGEWLFQFNEPIDASSVSTTDVVAFTGPTGQDLRNQITQVQVTGNNLLVRFSDRVAAGSYSMSIGPDILDQAGNRMDQDADGTAGETGDDRYSSTITLRSPDLVPESLLPSVLTAPLGTPLSVTWTVRNTGNEPARSNWTDRILLSTDDRLGSDTTLGNILVDVDPLTAGGSYTLTRQFTLPLNLALLPGDYKLLLVSDVYGQQGEDNEANNVLASATISLTEPSVPDIQISAVVAPAIMEAGKPATISWTSSNLGSAATTGGWYERVLLSSDTQLGGDTYLTEIFVSALAANASTARSATFTVPANLGTSTWHVLVQGDYYNQVNEYRNENNNHAFAPQTSQVVVAVEDLVVSQVGVVANAEFGQPVTVNWTVRNAGTGPTITNWVDRIWLSTDGVEGGDIYLGEFSSAGDTPLAAGAEYQRARDVTLPLDATLNPGNYRILVRTDIYNQEPETNENNNLGVSNAITLALPLMADLVATAPAVPGGLRAGDSANLTFNLSNQGQIAASDFRYRLLLNDTTSTSGAEFVLGDYLFSDTLAAGESLALTQRVTFPITLPGNWHVVLQVDSNNRYFEHVNEGNNVAASAQFTLPLPPLPDLRVSNIVAPLDGIAGQQVPITWTITNLGTAPVIDGSWTDRVALSRDGGGNDNHVAGQFTFEGSLAVGASITRTQLVQLPANVTTSYTVVVTTDINGAVYEGTGEGNNRRTDDSNIRTVLPPTPNLVVASITPPTEAFSSTQTELSWVVRNTGVGATSSPVWYDQVVLSLNTTFGDGDDIDLGYVANPAYLAAGDEYVNRLTFTVPRGLAGDYHLLVRTDAFGSVFENTDEGDNTGASTLTRISLTPPPDLRVQTVQAPNVAFSGQLMPLNWTVTNAGTGRTLEASWTDRVYVSDDNVLDAGDRELARVGHHGALDPGQGYSANADVRLPVGEVGERWFFVVADSFNNVYEHVLENNNSGLDEQATLVRLTPPPDLEVDSITLPAEARTGSSFSFQYEVRNYGASATAENYWQDSFYLSRDRTLDAADLLLGSRGRGGVLGVDESYVNAPTLALPNAAEGLWHVIVHTDSALQVFEGFPGVGGDPNANNIVASANTIQVQLRPADLVVQNLVAPATGEAGKQIVVAWDTHNAGSGGTQAGWTDRLMLSRDALLGDDDDIQLAGIGNADVLAAGATRAQSTTITLPFSLEGNYTLYVRTDAGNTLFEGAGGEANNISSQAFAVTRLTPDLVASNVSAQAPATADDRVVVRWRVSNDGANRTNSNFWHDEVWLSRDTTLGSEDLSLGRFLRSNPLNAAESYDAERSFALPAGLGSGQYHVIVRTDIDQRVIEGTAGEQNNIALGGVIAVPQAAVRELPRPDLQVAAVDAPEQAISGQSISLSWTVTNQGPDATSSRTWFDAVYLSRDLVFDRSSDTYLGYVDHTGGLASGASYDASGSFQVPLGLSGPFYMFVVADSGRTQADTDLGNNAGSDSGLVAVSLAPPADLVVGEIDIPDTGVPGSQATLTYTINNQGTNAALGTWRDTLYLSTDTSWDIGDLAVGSVQVRGPLAGGQSYTRELTAALPGVTPGSYHVIVRSDILNQVVESNDANNLSGSLDAVALDLQQLPLGGSVTRDLATGQSAYYKLVVVAGETVRVHVSGGAEGSGNELYLRQGSMPTRGQFDESGRSPFEADQVAVIADTVAGTYYVMVYGANGGSRQVTISAEVLPFSLQAVDRLELGDAGFGTLRVEGAKFSAGTTFFLENPLGERLQASAFDIENPSLAYVTFDPRGATLGSYALRATNPDGSIVTYAETLQVIEGFGAEILHRIEGPAQVRPERMVLANLVYANQGDADTMAPLIIVNSSTGTAFGSTADTVGLSSAVQYLGVAPDGDRSVLRPGDQNSLPLLFRSVNGPMRFSATSYEAHSAQPIDFEVVKRSLRTTDLNDTQWEVRWLTQLQPRIGNTWGEYVRLVNDLSKRFSTAEHTVYDVRELFRQAFAADADFLPSTGISGVLNHADGALPLAGIEVAAMRVLADGQYEFAASAITAADGSFSIRGLQAGNYIMALGGASTSDGDGISGTSSAFAFDMDRDGTEDADSPRHTLTGTADVAGLVLYARASAASTAQGSQDDPALATDAQGRLHMVWMREGALWHAVDEGSGFAATGPLPDGAAGSQVQLLFDARLIGGAGAGLLATWRTGEGNGTAIHYSVGERLGDGSYRWTTPALLTNNAWFDGEYAVAVGADGMPVYVGQRSDVGGNDDTDLYSGRLSLAQLQWAQSFLHELKELVQTISTSSDAELEEMGIVRYRWGYRIGQSVPLLKKIELEFRVDLRGQLGCTLVLGGNGALRIKIGPVEIEGRFGGDLRFVANKETCEYDFQSGRLGFSVAGAFNIKPTTLSFISPPAYPGLLLAEVLGFSVRVEASVGGRLVWEQGDSLSWADADKQGTARFSLGGEYEGKVWGIGEAKIRVLGNFLGNFDSSGLRWGEPPFTLSGLLRWKTSIGAWQEITFTYPGSGDSPLGMDGQLLSLEHMLAIAAEGAEGSITYGWDAPEVYGTLNDYGSDGEQQLNDDLTSQGRPVVAEAADGSLWLAYSDIDGIHVAAGASGGTWGAASIIPGSDFDSLAEDIALAVDGNGDLLAIWSRFDATGLGVDSTSEQIGAAFARGADLMFARRDATTGVWTTPEVFMARDGKDREPVLHRLDSGDVVAAWLGDSSAQTQAPPPVVYAARWNANTNTWSAAETVASAVGAVKLRVSDLAGAPVLVWTEVETGTKVLRRATWNGSSFDDASTLQIQLAMDLMQAQADFDRLQMDSSMPAADGSSELHSHGILPFSPPEECCDEEDEDPYEPDPIVPRDPNDILGPVGFGEQGWIPATDTFGYTIRFENAADAAAPAQEVVVTQQLDADLDWRTFRIDDFGFGDQRIELDGKSAFLSRRLDFSASKGFMLDVSAAIDITTGIVTWKLSTIDPQTGEIPTDALKGFLPPNKDADGNKDGRGEGFLTYTVRAKRSIATGAVIDAQARIIFDTEEPIDTPPIFNTLDAGVPTSEVLDLSAMVDGPSFNVSWAGSDAEGGSAIGGYDIYASVDGGEWAVWLANTQLTESLYDGEAGRSYRFYSVARDNAGNEEAAPTDADTGTTVAAGFGALAGQVREDMDGDGQSDTGDAGLGGWTVFLDTDDDGKFDTGERSTITSDDGSWRIDNVVAGTAIVGLVMQSEWLATGPASGSQAVTVVADGTAGDVDFLVFEHAVLSGVVFDDLNANGMQDNGEAVLAGQTVRLDRGNDGTDDLTQTTGEDGRWRFASLRAGPHSVSLQGQSGRLITAPGTGIDGDRYSVTASSGLLQDTLDFGSVAAASISGVKYEDVNGNGQRDADESGLAGWTIFIDANANGVLDNDEASTISGTQGQWQFTNLLPGSYTLAEVMQSGWMQTDPGMLASAGTGNSALDGLRLSASQQLLETPDVALTAAAAPSGTANVNGAAHSLIGLDALRADPRFAGIDGSGLSTVIIDTGIDLDHAFFGPDLNQDGRADRIIYQYDFANDDADASDRSGHGSNVASLIGAADGAYGGVAPGADLIALKVFQDNGRGTFSYLENALRWVLLNADSHRIGVVNLSLGDGGNWTGALSRYGIGDELAALAARNILVTAASGNSFARFGGAWGVAYPAADPAVLSVGASWASNAGGPWNFSGGATDYSTGADRLVSFGQRDDDLLDVLAPGTRWVGANATGGTATMHGTSQASAVMAGVATLAQDVALQALGRRLSMAEFSALLDATSALVRDGDDENDNVRNSGLTFGRVDVYALAQAILALPASGGGGSGDGGGGIGGGGSGQPRTAAPAVLSVTVSAGQATQGLAFGNFRLGKVEGLVYDDANSNGALDPGELGQPGYTVYLDANGNEMLDDGESSQASGNDGRYSFSDIGPGLQKLRLVAQDTATVLAGQAAFGMASGSTVQTSLRVNLAPSLAALAGLAIQEGDDAVTAAAGSDSNGDTLVYSLVGDAVAGATLDPGTGAFSWHAGDDGPAAQSFTVRVTDSAGGRAERSFTVTVNNVAPTLGVTGDGTAVAGTDYLLNLGASDPGLDTINQWRVDWGDGRVETFTGKPSSVLHRYASAGQFAISVVATDEDGDWSASGPVVTVAPAPPLKVTAFEATASGFVLRFNRTLDAAGLNLYDAADAAMGAADLVLTNAAGQRVAGSAVVAEDGRSLQFVRTGGLLAAGTYDLHLASGTASLRDGDGGQLDGNGDGTAGDNHLTRFTVAAANTAVLSVGEFARGPGQAVNLPAAAQGLPIVLSNAAGATEIEFTLAYDSRLLTMVGAINGAGLPGGSSIEVDLSQPGLVRVRVFAGAALAGGALELLRLQAVVPGNATYGAAQVLDLRDVRVNGGAITTRDDDGLHLVAYMGDVTGDRAYSALDVTRMQRVIVRQDTGFSPFLRTDPVVVGDINASGTLTSVDAALVQQLARGVARPEVPVIPAQIVAPSTSFFESLFMASRQADDQGGAKIDLTRALSERASGSGTGAASAGPDWVSQWLAPAKTGTVSMKLKAGPELIRLTPKLT